MPIFQKADVLAEARQMFTSSALAAFNLAGTEVLVARENSVGAIPGRMATTGALVNAGTGFIRGAFSVASDDRVAYASAVGNNDQNVATPVRLFVASVGDSGTVYSIRGTNLITQDVASAVAGHAQQRLTPIVDVVPTSPLAAAWDVGSNLLYVLDQLQPSPSTRALRLMTIDADGKGREIWSSPATATASFPSRFYVETSSLGEVLVAVSFASSSSWVLLGRDGVARNSGTWSDALASGPLVNDMVVAAPFRRSGGTPQQGPLRIEQVARSGMSLGVCSAAWLKDFVPSKPCGAGWAGTDPGETGSAAPACRNP